MTMDRHESGLTALLADRVISNTTQQSARQYYNSNDTVTQSRRIGSPILLWKLLKYNFYF